MQLADAPADVPATSTPWSPHLSAYRDCYSACRAAGGDEFACREQCADLEGSDATTSTIRGPCSGYWDCFVKGFAIPESVQQLPSTVGGVVRDVVTPINSTLLLLIGAGLVFLAIRR